MPMQQRGQIVIKIIQFPQYILLMSSALQKYLTEYLLSCNKLEIVAESIRKSLANNPYFQVVSVFERMDKFKKGFLEPADFSQFMLENQVYPTEGELYLIFKDFDKSKKGVVSLQQLAKELLPRQNKALKKKVQQRRAYPVSLKLELDLQFLLGKYFQDKINSIGIMNELREKMKILKPHAVGQAFHYLDSRNARFISGTTELDNFLRSNGKALKLEQLERIFRVLNFNQDCQISLHLFQQHLDPFGLGCYQGYKQKMLQKQSIQKIFLHKKYEVENLRTRNIVQNERINYEIHQLRDSNRRLREIMDEQELAEYYDRRRGAYYPYY